jgi:hypothetical protein
MTLADLFPEEDYRFHLRFERGTVAEFFRPTPEQDELLTQRRHWLQTAPQTHAALLPEGVPLLNAALELGRANGILPPDVSETPWERCLQLGLFWEPDFLLLKPDSNATLRLAAGCVCFPSSWSLAEKIGHPIETIHGVVPGLNAAIGPAIRGFMTKMRPGAAWLRANWGLSRSAELNQHPARQLPRLDGGARLEEVWLRVEHQAVAALPEGQGVLFGIRIAVHPLAKIAEDQSLAPRLIRALKTMPEPMAQYKNLAAARQRLISLLNG